MFDQHVCGVSERLHAAVDPAPHLHGSLRRLRHDRRQDSLVEAEDSGGRKAEDETYRN